MRRAILLLAVMAVMMLMASGVALAVTINGTPGDDFLEGTDAPETFVGKAGNDIINGFPGPDRIIGGPGDDVLFEGEDVGEARDILVGGPGDDILLPGNLPPGSPDVAICGPGNDTAYADPTDKLIGCETVTFEPPTF